MTAAKMAHFRGILDAIQTKLTVSLTGREVIAVNSTADMFDQIQLATERDLSIGFLERESSRLREVQAAVRRINAATFGMCVECGEQINIRRLDALPWATTCIVCREAADRRDEAYQYEMQDELTAREA